VIEIIANFKNVEYGIESFVTIHEKGFSVSLKDTDANEYICANKIFPEIMKNKAIETAKEWVA